MRTRRHDPIAIPLGHTEEAGYWDRLTTPAVARRQPCVPRWSDEPDEVRAEVRQAAIDQLTFRLQTARRVLAANPGLECVEAIDKLERALAAATRLQ